MNKATLLLATWTVVGALLGGCADDGSADTPDPTTSALPSTTSPSPTPPAWQSKFTDKQLEAYEDALARWEDYENRSAPIWQRGKATPAAQELFKKYFPSPRWRNEFSRLELYEANDVAVSGLATVYWSKAQTITKNSLNVEIVQCVDFADVITEQNGDPVEGNHWTTTPHVRVLSMSRPTSHDWLIYSYGDPEGKKRACTP